jgi:pimeloyl-ACP methyl ester carboxylesterase
MKSPTTAPQSGAVVLIHGIRTRAPWQNELKKLIEQKTNLKVVPIKYGFFDIFRFFLPGYTRRKPIVITEKKLRDAITQYSSTENPISVIAHSYGTYAISKILHENPDLRINNLILCGSIIDENYDWATQKLKIKGVIVNDIGTKDVWPAFAKSSTWGYGASGTYGFGSVGIEDRQHSLTHSEFLNTDFAKKYWVPILVDGVVKIPESTRYNQPFWFYILNFPWKWVILAFFISSIYGLYYAYFSSCLFFDPFSANTGGLDKCVQN